MGFSKKKGEIGYYMKVLILMSALIIPHLLIISVNARYPEPSIAQIMTSQGSSSKMLHKQQTRRMVIGSTAPTCTYNECKRCKFRCRAEQVPVDGNDPVNSAYRYKCICHR